MKRIYSLTEIDEYQSDLDQAQSRGELVLLIKTWPRALVEDALKQVESARFSWKEWARGLKLERKKQFAGVKFVKRYGAILMPEAMVYVSLLANQFHVPWGCAYLRIIHEYEKKGGLKAWLKEQKAAIGGQR